MLITVFTPSYNRIPLLSRLFESLRDQTQFNFEWIIVDDGSEEDLNPIVESFRRQLKNDEFPIVLIEQENSGKHVAINRGAEAARGDLFFIVDNDDFLATDAIAEVTSAWDAIKDDPSFGGLCYNRCTMEGKSFGNPQYAQFDCTPLYYRYKRKEKGDRAEVIRTELFREFPFPETPGERFCPEALFFDRMELKLRYLNKNIYYCEYLNDGLTAKIYEVRKNSPVNTCMYYEELINKPIPFISKFKAVLNYYRFARYLPKDIEYDIRYPYLAKQVAKMMITLIGHR